MSVSDYPSSKNGFSLLELIVVVAIIAVMAGFFLATYPASQLRARDSQRISDLDQYRSALQLYANSQETLSYPSDTNALLHNVCNSDLLPNNYASECPTDPSITNNYRYNAVNGGEDFYVYAQLEDDQEPNDGNKVFYVTTSYGNSGEVKTNTAPGKGGTPPFK